MKKLIIYFICVIFFQNVFAQEKYALIVAVTEYQPQTKWSNLATEQDAAIIKQALLARGFKEENIYVMLNETTKENIIKAFYEHLFNKVKPGDIAFLHFSGHGYQIPDDDGDETDEFDEALVPADAPFDRGKSYPIDYYANYIRDDEFGKLLDELRLKLQQDGNILVSIDACHSGTATRGLGPVRGAVREPSQTGVAQTNKTNNADWGFSKPKEGMAPMTCFFASSEFELNKEYHSDEIKCGSLSYALSKALTETDINISYRALFEKVRNTLLAIVPGQTPHIEGDMDRIIFGGQLLSKPVYMKVNNWINEKEVEINAGKLMQLNPGSIVSFYPPDTRNTENIKPLATGVVKSCRTIDAIIDITEGTLSKETALSSWVYVTEKNFGDMNITVKITSKNNKDKNSIVNKLNDYPFIKKSDENFTDILIEIGNIEGKDKDSVRITTKQDYITYAEKIERDEKGNLKSEQIDEIILKLIGYSQANFLRGIEVDNPELKASIKIIPLKLKESAIGKKNPNPFNDFEELDSTAIYKDKSNIPVITEGMYIRIAVENQSEATLYYSIIDIMPDNDLYVIYPKAGKTPQEYRVYSGVLQKNESSVFQIGPPYGDDMLKLIVTSKAMDLMGIAQTRGAGNTRGTGSSFEKLFQNSFKQDASTRGPASVPVEVEDIGIYSLVYKIVKK